jgi:YgiT-type zinc finger domain-containing protein
MKCGMYSGSLKSGTGCLLVNLENQDVIISNLAILKCTSCGEEFLTAAADKRVEEVIQEYKQGKSPLKR